MEQIFKNLTIKLNPIVLVNTSTSLTFVEFVTTPVNLTIIFTKLNFAPFGRVLRVCTAVFELSANSCFTRCQRSIRQKYFVCGHKKYLGENYYFEITWMEATTTSATV